MQLFSRLCTRLPSPLPSVFQHAPSLCAHFAAADQGIPKSRAMMTLRRGCKTQLQARNHCAPRNGSRSHRGTAITVFYSASRWPRGNLPAPVRALLGQILRRRFAAEASPSSWSCHSHSHSELVVIFPRHASAKSVIPSHLLYSNTNLTSASKLLPGPVRPSNSAALPVLSRNSVMRAYLC